MITIRLISEEVLKMEKVLEESNRKDYFKFQKKEKQNKTKQ